MRKIKLIFIFLAALACASCAVTTPRDGEYRLRSNKVKVDSRVKASDLTPYIRQQSETFALFWTKPVYFQEDLVEASVTNMESHLEYLGFYDSKVESTVKKKNSNVTVE